MRTTSADLYTTPEELETVLFSYDYIKTNDELFSGEPGYYHINMIELKMPLQLTGHTDIEEDLRTAIAEDLGVDPFYIKIECLIEFSKHLKSNSVKQIAA